MLLLGLPASPRAYDSTFANFAQTGIFSFDVIGIYTATFRASFEPEHSMTKFCTGCFSTAVRS